MTGTAARILVVDDDAVVRQSVQRVLEQDHHCVDQAGSGAEALRLLAAGDYQVVLLDMRMPSLGGLTVLQHVQSRHPNTVIVMMTGFPSVENAKESIHMGAFEFLQKPLDADRIRSVVAQALACRPWKMQRRC